MNYNFSTMLLLSTILLQLNDITTQPKYFSIYDCCFYCNLTI